MFRFWSLSCHSLIQRTKALLSPTTIAPFFQPHSFLLTLLSIPDLKSPAFTVPSSLNHDHSLSLTFLNVPVILCTFQLPSLQVFLYVVVHLIPSYNHFTLLPVDSAEDTWDLSPGTLLDRDTLFLDSHSRVLRASPPLIYPHALTLRLFVFL